MNGKYCLLYSSGDMDLHYKLSNLCDKHGYEFLCSFNLADFVTKYHLKNPALLFVDSKLPGCHTSASDFIKSVGSICPNLFIITRQEDAKDFASIGSKLYEIKPEYLVNVFKQESSTIDQKNSNLSKNITSYLKCLGLSDKYIGFRYLTSLIMDIKQDKSSYSSFRSKLYPLVAKEYNTTPSSVERDIRFLIKAATKSPEFTSSFTSFSNRSVIGAILSQLEILAI